MDKLVETLDLEANNEKKDNIVEILIPEKYEDEDEKDNEKENDLNEVEDELNNIFNSNPKNIQFGIQGDKKTGTKKNNLINELQEMSRKTGIEIEEEKKLKRLTIPELEKLLSIMWSEGVKKTANISDNPKKIADECDIRIEKANNQKIDISADIGSIALYQINKAFAELIEKGHNMFLSDKTKCIINGYSENLESKKDILLEYYKKVFNEHKSSIEKYASPMSIILIINSQVLIGSVIKSEKKN